MADASGDAADKKCPRCCQQLAESSDILEYCPTCSSSRGPPPVDPGQRETPGKTPTESSAGANAGVYPVDCPPPSQNSENGAESYFPTPGSPTAPSRSIQHPTEPKVPEQKLAGICEAESPRILQPSQNTANHSPLPRSGDAENDSGLSTAPVSIDPSLTVSIPQGVNATASSDLSVHDGGECATAEKEPDASDLDEEYESAEEGPLPITEDRSKHHRDDEQCKPLQSKMVEDTSHEVSDGHVERNYGVSDGARCGESKSNNIEPLKVSDGSGDSQAAKEVVLGGGTVKESAERSGSGGNAVEGAAEGNRKGGESNGGIHEVEEAAKQNGGGGDILKKAVAANEASKANCYGDGGGDNDDVKGNGGGDGGMEARSGSGEGFTEGGRTAGGNGSGGGDDISEAAEGSNGGCAHANDNENGNKDTEDAEVS